MAYDPKGRGKVNNVYQVYQLEIRIGILSLIIILL
jgi:hypothetical protein